MIEELWGTSVSRLAGVAVSAVAVLATVIVVVRIVGLRSFSKMSSFDFAVTVAVGSLVASVAAASVPLPDGALAIAALLGSQWVVAKLRTGRTLAGLVDNTPTVLVAHGRFVEANLERTRITELDVIGKLREANVAQLSEVTAVVLETTGDISVMHGHRDMDPELLRGVAGAEMVIGPEG